MVHFDGAVPNQEWSRLLLSRLQQIGPDNQQSITKAGVTFGHALLKTSFESKNTIQPIVFDENSMLVGDVRLDGRDSVIRRLSLEKAHQYSPLTDIELILYAWRKWGPSLTEQLAGDFSFAIWDAANQRLFCARDQFGIRTFYYYKTSQFLFFSNSLNALLSIPTVDRTLNRESIGDYLLFRQSMNPAATSFKNIHQLTPASQAEFTHSRLKTRNYWSFPIEPIMSHQSDSEVIEQFEELLEQAVSDRTHCDSIGIMVSAGLDSTSLTIKTRDQFLSRGNSEAIHLLTMHGKDDPDDKEHLLVRRFAADLGLKLQVTEADSNNIYRPPGHDTWPAPEVWWYKWNRIMQPGIAALAQLAKVGLTGHGGDSAMTGNSAYLTQLLRRGEFLTYLKEFWAFFNMHGRRPPLGIQSALKKRFEPALHLKVPNWYDQDFVRETNLQQRLTHFLQEYTTHLDFNHPLRPAAYRQLTSNYWTYVLPAYDSQVSGFPIQFSHPFFDLRILQFLLRVPSPRWYHGKALLRKAISEQPHYIRNRSKHVFDFNSRRQALIDLGKDVWANNLAAVQTESEFINIERYATLTNSIRSLTAVEADALIPVVCLARWRQEIELLS